jgi:transposase InsO family protein
MPVLTTRQTVTVLRKRCAQNGVPETMVNDNGIQFTAQEFKEFCSANTVTNILSPPYRAQCNGRAERFVDNFKCDSLKLRGKGFG